MKYNQKGDFASQIVLGGSSTGANEASNNNDEKNVFKIDESIDMFDSKNSMIDQSIEHENIVNKKINTYKSVIIDNSDALAVIRSQQKINKYLIKRD